MDDEKIKLVMIQVHLQTLRRRLLVVLNKAYPEKLDIVTIQEILHTYHEDEGQIKIARELFYLSEIGFVHSRHKKRWQVSALGRDFLLGLVGAKGVGEPVGYGDIGEL
jgi:hypothetical protein